MEFKGVILQLEERNQLGCRLRGLKVTKEKSLID